MPKLLTGIVYLAVLSVPLHVAPFSAFRVGTLLVAPSANYQALLVASMVRRGDLIIFSSIS